MKYFRTPEELGSFAGFKGAPEEEGYSMIVAGPERIYSREKTGRRLNQHQTRRIAIGIHNWPPGKAHGSHRHENWEHLYYVISGKARITVGSETKTMGPGGSAYMPPGMEHDIVAVGDERMVAAVVVGVLD